MTAVTQTILQELMIAQIRASKRELKRKEFSEHFTAVCEGVLYNNSRDPVTPQERLLRAVTPGTLKVRNEGRRATLTQLQATLQLVLHGSLAGCARYMRARAFMASFTRLSRDWNGQIPFTSWR